MSRNAIQKHACQVLVCSAKRCKKVHDSRVNRVISRSNSVVARALLVEVGLVPLVFAGTPPLTCDARVAIREAAMYITPRCDSNMECSPLRRRDMIRAKVWFRCAAMHDPVLPVLKQPALIGWEGKNRNIDLVIEREFKGNELLGRMKGWITIDPRKVIEVIENHGRLKCFETGELVVELEDGKALEALQTDIEASFGDQCNLEPFQL